MHSFVVLLLLLRAFMPSVAALLLLRARCLLNLIHYVAIGPVRDEMDDVYIAALHACFCARISCFVCRSLRCSCSSCFVLPLTTLLLLVAML